MKRSSYLIQIFAIYFVSINFGTNLAQKTNGSSKIDAIKKLSEAIAKINIKLDALDNRLNTLQATLKQKITPDESKCLILDVVDAVDNQQFEVAEEKLTELADNKKISKIVQGIYKGSVANVDKIVVFAKALKEAEFQFQVFNGVLDEIVSGGSVEPIKLIKLVQSFEREVNKRHDKSLKKRADTVIDKATDIIKDASVAVFQSAMIANKYENNNDIDNLANTLFKFKPEVSGDVMDRVVDSAFGVVAAGKILDNISSHKNIPQVIQGLTSIFNRFNYAGNLNNDATLNLASHLRQLQDRNEYKSLSRDLKEQVQDVVQRLPLCARNLYFHTYACLWNKAKQQYLYAARENYDDYHRHIFLWYPGDIPPGALWHINRTGDAFYFVNDVHNQEYLFSPIDPLSWDKDNRFAFTWIQGYNKNPESSWGIELDGDVCYIKTIFNNEYLYASDTKYNQMNTYVFTWRPGSLMRTPEFQWEIRNCGEVDTRRL